MSFFEKEIEWGGDTWVLLYDPADPMAVTPNLQGGVLRGQTCSPVKLPNQKADFWLVVLDIEIPSSIVGTEAVPSKHLKGIRLYDHQPVSLATLQTADMVYYVKKPVLSTNGGTAQQFLDTVLGTSLNLAERQAEADRSWSRTMLAGVNDGREVAESAGHPVKPVQRAVSNGEPVA